MPQQRISPDTVTVTPIGGGLAYVYGRVVARSEGAASSRWEYLGSSTSREEVMELARRTANGRDLWMDEPGAATAEDSTQDGIAPTRPPADS